MKRLTLFVIIVSSFIADPLCAMDGQEGRKLQAELQGIRKENKKIEDDYLSQVEKWGHRQLEHVENEKRKNEALRRSCSFFIYSMTGIGIVVVGILLYQICKKPKTDKE